MSLSGSTGYDWIPLQAIKDKYPDTAIIDRAGADGYWWAIANVKEQEHTISASLPNISGNFGEFMYSGIENCTGPFEYIANSTAKMGGTTAKNKGYISMDLNLYGTWDGIHGVSDTVNPKALAVQYYIKY